MNVQHVDIVCDRGIWHEHKAGHGKRRSVLARFVPEADPEKADVPGWRLVPKEPSGRTPGALARAEVDRSHIEWDHQVVGEAPDGKFQHEYLPLVRLFPCECGWPTYRAPSPESLADLLDGAAAQGASCIHVDDLNARAHNGAKLAHYEPAPSFKWDIVARMSRTKSVFMGNIPDDYECLAEEEGHGRWLQVVCDGGERHAEWHRKRGARVIAGFMGKDDRGSYKLCDEAGEHSRWGLSDWGVMNDDAPTVKPVYVFHPCPCGREFPTMDQEKVHHVMEKLAMQRCHAVTVDTFLRSLALV